MKNFLVAIAAVLMLTSMSAANAADMAVKVLPSSAAPAFNWNGLYAGLNIGGGWGRVSNIYAFAANAGGVFPVGVDTSRPDGIIGGGQLGYNWPTGFVVVGIETDIQGSSQQRGAVAPGLAATCLPGCSVPQTDKLTWFGTTRGRIGIASGNWLAYLTGGAAYGELRSSGTFATVLQIFPFSNSTTRAGRTVGGGVERHWAGIGPGESNTCTWISARRISRIQSRRRRCREI